MAEEELRERVSFLEGKLRSLIVGVKEERAIAADQVKELEERLAQAEIDYQQQEDKTARLLEYVRAAKESGEWIVGRTKESSVNADVLVEISARAEEAEKLASDLQSKNQELHQQLNDAQDALFKAEAEATQAKFAAESARASSSGNASEAQRAAEARAEAAEMQCSTYEGKIAQLVSKVKAERDEQQAEVTAAREALAEAQRQLASGGSSSSPPSVDVEALRAQITMLRIDNEALREQLTSGRGGGLDDAGASSAGDDLFAGISADDSSSAPPPPPPGPPPPPVVQSSSKLNIVRKGPRPDGGSAPALRDPNADLMSAIASGVKLRTVSKGAIETAGSIKAKPTPSRSGGGGGFDFGNIALMAQDLAKKRGQRVAAGQVSAPGNREARKSMALTNLMLELDQ